MDWSYWSYWYGFKAPFGEKKNNVTNEWTNGRSDTSILELLIAAKNIMSNMFMYIYLLKRAEPTKQPTLRKSEEG
jgi:hypothetical protein